MIDLPDVTLFTVSSIDIDKHIYALRKSMEGINFGAVKFVTHEDLELDENMVGIYPLFIVILQLSGNIVDGLHIDNK